MRRPPTSPTSMTWSASYGGGTKTTTFTITPAAAGLSLATLSLNRSSIVGGTTATGTVTLTAAAPSGGAAVTLSSSAPSIASVPASVVVAAGATSASFTVTTAKVTKNAFATISASYGGVTKSVSVAIKHK